ncbi:MAG TPA: orotidine-5'-phosphate decarboxylase [Bacteroidales bacterium]|jgi:orotidine-5'-phosphate decarboxylase|nr:orotidine-5'-phosphate decarboxylase [Bacteroidales bacterium]HNY53657.1 orotidine-5'-phosphate decarboxylase [Bacteroidales bacterium]HOG57603.1 orotidine-5'-phosphate decarboxylase [Bacteroidales bacterium]HPB13519.1 orotidine-5'-phosphate decarboxylase [Bacteroidales bacterium]HPV16257.1 orotidine-5'-phosphate decarboxylase [Bacteroidales bacterium]
MDHDGLFRAISVKRSFLCIGLDSDLEKIPPSLLKAKDPVLEFNKRIIDSTHSYAVAYKPNTAFYESMGPKGWHTLESTLDYIKTRYPGIFVIADAKRGDIGNTSKMYARAFFETMDFDAVTVAPYMGEDSVAPFLEYPGKWVILLALTSNRGADDFQYHNEEGLKLYEKVLRLSGNWGTIDNLMYVVGATRAAMLKDIRKIVPEHFLLVPGVGAQGGSLGDVAAYGLTDKCGLLVNSSRAILFADNTENFDRTAAEKAMEIQKEMESHLAAHKLI